MWRKGIIVDSSTLRDQIFNHIDVNIAIKRNAFKELFNITETPGCSTWDHDSDSDDGPKDRSSNLSQRTLRELRTSLTNSFIQCPISKGAPKSGVVLKLVLKNFMCHSHMEINLNPCLNFIIGRNGSGKSAILTALVVGLGGSAFATNRGSALKQFIKNDMSSAMIEITLNNAGFNAYKPDLFGDKIIVTRKLTDNGSSYTIKGSDGTVVFTKREDLVNIIEHLGVQVDNPISILNQDTARSFLNSSNPREKYQLYMRATQLQTLWDIAFKSIESKRAATVMLREKRHALRVTKRELDALELKWNQVRAVQGYRKKVANLRDEFNWAMAVVEETNLKTIEQKKAEQEALLPALELAVSNQASDEIKTKEKLHSVEKRINDIREEASGKEATYSESKLKATRCKESYARMLQSYKVLGVKVQRHETNVHSLRSEIDKLQHGNEANSAERRLQIRNKIATKESKYHEMGAIQKTVDHHLAQLRGHDNKHKEDLQQNRAELVECNRKLNKLQEQISSMQSNSSNKLAVYGRYMPHLVQKISEAVAKGKFKKAPIGPIGAYIQVKDATWAPAIENFLGSFIRHFLVEDSADFAVLNDIFKSVLGNQRKPPVIISTFHPKIHNVSTNTVHAPEGTCSLLHALIISNIHVTNCLIDQREIETVLLIPTSNEACEIMRDRRRVPRNCKRSVTKQGEQFYPDPDYRTYAGNVSANSQYLQVNMAEVIRTKQAELANCEARKEQLDAEVGRVHAALKDNDAEMSRLRREKTVLQQTQVQLDAELQALRDSEEPEITSIATLHTELEESSVQLRALKEEEKNLVAECELLKREMEEARRETVALRESARTLQSREQPLLVELENVRDELRELTTERGFRARKLHDLQEKLKALEDRAAQQRRAVEEAVELAARMHPERIDTERTPMDLDREIKGLEKVVANVERDTGDYAAVGTELTEKKERYQQVDYIVTEVGKALDFLDTTLENRKAIYTDIQKYTSSNVNETFLLMLRESGFTGQVMINHIKQELMIEVQPCHRKASDDTKTLSGGERSYSTVMFIISLWEVSNPPFFFLDEFDVFMDKVNRRVTLDLLISQAKRKPNYQFVFLTPQDLSAVTAKHDVSIHRMGNPRD